MANRRTWKQKLTRGYLWLTLLWIPAYPLLKSLPGTRGYNSGQTGWMEFWVYGFTATIIGWMVVWVVCMLVAVDRVATEATRPIPSPAEIELQLRREGYDPSIQDCIAVEQHLKSNRNEAAVLLGGILVGLHVAGNQARGKPLL